MDDDDYGDGQPEAKEITGRAAALRRAKEIIDITLRPDDEDITDVLAAWTFSNNFHRRNSVLDANAPQDAVPCDIFGVVKGRLTTATRTCSLLPALLTRWLRARLPHVDSFAFTSICVNGEFACQRHRDVSNVGLSVAHAFGNFKGGALGYCSADDLETPLNAFRADEFHFLDIGSSEKSAIFDGKRAHFVSKFEGRRFSVVFYVDKSFDRVQDADRQFLVQKLGFLWPGAQHWGLETVGAAGWAWLNHRRGRLSHVQLGEGKPRSRSRSR